MADSRIGPVSYTHLDVYKRQTLVSGIHAVKQDSFPLRLIIGQNALDVAKARLMDIPCAMGFQIVPVSYTHLDVYKRQVLNMTVEEAVVFFSNQPKIARKLQTLLDVGLGLSLIHILRLVCMDAYLVVLLVVLPPCGEPPGLRDTHRDGVVLLFE